MSRCRIQPSSKLPGLMLVGLLLLAAGGCASWRVKEVVQPVREARLFVVHAGEDFVLRWESRTNTSYTVLYTSSLWPRPEWKVLPGAEQIQGTGAELTVKDRGDLAEMRYYRLQVHLQP